MMLLTKQIKKRLIANGTENNAKRADPANVSGATIDFKPVVKFFNPSGAYTGIFSELDPDNLDTLYGLADHGHGCPELGYSSLAEIAACKCPPFGLPIERDYWFEADRTLSKYAKRAREEGLLQA